MHLHPLKTPAPLSGVSVLSRCTQRGPEHIFAQNYFPCPSPPYCSLQRDGGATCHAGGGGTQMAHQMCGHGTWREARRREAGLGADAEGPLGHLISCMPLKRRRVKGFGFLVFFYKISVHLCIPARVLVASPRLPTILLLHSWPPHPSQLPLGLPLAPSAWQSLRFGRSPTSPPWQLLPSAVLSQTASGSDKVTPPATGFGAAGWLAGWLGGWVGGWKVEAGARWTKRWQGDYWRVFARVWICETNGEFTSYHRAQSFTK